VPATPVAVKVRGCAEPAEVAERIGGRDVVPSVPAATVSMPLACGRGAAPVREPPAEAIAKVTPIPDTGLPYVSYE